MRAASPLRRKDRHLHLAAGNTGRAGTLAAHRHCEAGKREFYGRTGAANKGMVKGSTACGANSKFGCYLRARQLFAGQDARHAKARPKTARLQARGRRTGGTGGAGMLARVLPAAIRRPSRPPRKDTRARKPRGFGRERGGQVRRVAMACWRVCKKRAAHERLAHGLR